MENTISRKEVNAQNMMAEGSAACAKILQDTFHHPDRRLWQAAAVADGIVIGGIKSAPDQVLNHPQEVVSTAALGTAVGLLIGAAAVLRKPWLSGSVFIASTGLTGVYAANLGQRLGRDEQLQSKLNLLWNCPSLQTFSADTRNRTTPRTRIVHTGIGRSIGSRRFPDCRQVRPFASAPGYSPTHEVGISHELM